MTAATRRELRDLLTAAYDRLRDAGIARERQRVGPLPLTPRSYLAAGWPDLLARLEARYGPRWAG